MKARKTLAAALLLLALVAGCKDPYACGPGDRDGDGDGRCHEDR